MNRVACFLAALWVCLLAGCQTTVTGVQVSYAPLFPMTLEAAKAAIDHWKLTKIADSTYMWEGGRYDNSTSMFLRGEPDEIWEIRHGTAESSREGVSEADELNGIEYRGSVMLSFRTWRTCWIPADTAEWSPWSDKTVTRKLSVKKVNGVWEVGDDPHTYRKVTPADLPPDAKRQK